MKVSRLAPLALCLFTPFLGCSCGGDDAGASGGGSSESSGSDSGGTTTSSTSASNTGVDGSGGSGSSDETGGSSSGGGGGEVYVSGIVHDYFGGAMNPVPGAEVSVYDMPGITATTDDMGAFSLGPLPPSTEIAIVLAPSTDYMGGIFPYATTDVDDDEAQIPQISRMTVQMQMDGIVDQMPATPDLMQGIMIVGNQLMTDVLGTVIEVAPMPAADTYYAPDDMGFPVLGENTLTWPVLSVVVFFNVPDYAPGDVVVTPTNATTTCSLPHTEFPTMGEHVTFVLVECG